MSSQSTSTPERAMAPICEAIDAVLHGLTIRIENDVIKSVETIVLRDGVEVSRKKDLMKFDIDDLLNGLYDGNYFGGWDEYIKDGIKEFSIVDMSKFKNLKGSLDSYDNTDVD